MVFAHSSEQAVAYMSENMTPQSVKDVSSRMRVEFYDDSTKTNFTLHSMLQSVTTFPYYAFTLNTNKPTLEDLEDEYYRIDRKRS